MCRGYYTILICTTYIQNYKPSTRFKTSDAVNTKHVTASQNESLNSKSHLTFKT